MNREIKFNAFDGAEYIRFDEWKAGHPHECYPNALLADFLHSHFACEIVQFTGIKDSNNKEIYEGDIVHIEHYNNTMQGVVEWGGDMYPAFMIEEIEGECNAFSWLVNESAATFEVIGNIFENPEMLEK